MVQYSFRYLAQLDYNQATTMITKSNLTILDNLIET